MTTLPGSVTRYNDVTAFLTHVEPLLLEDEALNSLMLGVTLALQRQSQPRRRRAPILAIADSGSTAELAAAMTGPYRLLIAGHDDAPEQLIDAMVADLAELSRPIPAVFGPAPLAQRWAVAWSQITGVGHELGMIQRLYEARTINQPPQVAAGHMRPAEDTDEELLSEWLWAFQQEALPEEASDPDAARLIVSHLLANDDLFVWEVDDTAGRQAVSMAARARPTRHGVAVNLVYTPPNERRRGYASACVASLSRLLLDSGWAFCTLFTDRTNATANHIYEQIGYVPLADFDEYRFH